MSKLTLTLILARKVHNPQCPLAHASSTLSGQRRNVCSMQLPAGSNTLGERMSNGVFVNNAIRGCIYFVSMLPMKIIRKNYICHNCKCQLNPLPTYAINIPYYPKLFDLESFSATHSQPLINLSTTSETSKASATYATYHNPPAASEKFLIPIQPLQPFTTSLQPQKPPKTSTTSATHSQPLYNLRNLKPLFTTNSQP